MDGFHLSQSRLAELGRQHHKGAIDTFDGPGFLTLVRRLRYPDGETIYAPQFRREIDEPVARTVPIELAATLVVIEGNHLLIPVGPWGKLRALSHGLVGMGGLYRLCGDDRPDQLRAGVSPARADSAGADPGW
jgi:hypothetical protein